MVFTNRGEIGRPYPIKRFYNSMNGNPEKIRYLKPFHKDIPTYVRSFDGDRIRLHKITGCTHSGKKKVYLLTLDDGKTIKATECHRIMTTRGWVPLGELQPDIDSVMVDNMKKVGKPTRKKKKSDNLICNLHHHPYAVEVPTKRGQRTKRLEIHRAIFEAALNAMTLEEYKKVLRTDPKRVSEMMFLDPKKFHIHHKNHNHHNNALENLDAMPCLDHQKHHGDESAFGQGIPEYSRVKRIEYQGEEDTYDIECEDPHHNFVANGMVVHNSGKTEVFIEVCDRWVTKTKTAVLILSHLGLLTTQTFKRFELRKPHLKIGKLQAGVYPRKDADVVIGTMQTGRAENHSNILEAKLTKSVGMIIVDEAHYLYCNSYDKIFAKWPHAKILGVTATPFRNRQLMTGFFESIAYSISLKELIDQGYLVPPELHQIKEKGTDPTETLAQTVQIYAQEQPTSPGIVYVDTIANASLIRQMFETVGIKARAVTSEITGQEREDIFESFNEGKTQVLCNVNVLTAGFDSARVRTIFMPFGVSSPTQYLQRIGRGLRIQPPDKTRCDVYVFGNAPMVASGLYQKYQTEALTNKTEDRQETVYDDLEFGDLSAEQYNWTMEVVKACDKLKEYGQERLANLLARKEFPRKFMANITELMKRLPPIQQQYGTNEPCNTPQQEVLTKGGFKREDVQTWTKEEASLIIGIMLAPHTKSLTNCWIVPTGPHAGKHIKDVPWAYKSIVAKRFPGSPIGKLIRKYHYKAYAHTHEGPTT